MCGHATIALGRFLVDTQDKNVFPRRGQVHFDEEKAECRLRLHAPCGVVDVTVPSIREGERVRSDPERKVQFVSVESFAAAVDLEVEVPEGLRWQELRGVGKSAVKFDVAYGGAFYVIVQEKELGFERIRDGVDVKRLDAATATLKQLVSARKEIFRGQGLAADLEYLYGVIVVDEGEGWVGLGGMDGGRVGACFFADQQLDRSPTGSGVSARVALAKAKGLLRDGEHVRFDSLLSARAGGEAGAFVGSAMAGGRVLVQGRAFYTGASAFVVEDALSRGGDVGTTDDVTRWTPRVAQWPPAVIPSSCFSHRPPNSSCPSLAWPGHAHSLTRVQASSVYGRSVDTRASPVYSSRRRSPSALSSVSTSR